MRQVFSSRRVDNVEKVAQLLRDAGIEVKVTHGQSYHGRRRTFSYRERPGNEAAAMPTVWIVHAEDQVRGREILRDAGLLDSSRPGEGGFLPPELREGARKRGGSLHWRVLLLLAIAVAIGLVMYANRQLARRPAIATAAPPVATPIEVAADAREVFARPVPSALAAQLVREARLDGPAPCVLVDGAPASDAVRAALEDHPIRAADACGPQVDIRIGPWRTDGSGDGTVAVQVLGGAVVVQRARRQGTAWRIAGQARSD